MKIAYFWMTQKGHELTCRLQKAMGGIIEPKAEFPKTVQRDFQDCDALVFVMAMGIVVRTIAPLIRSKDKDPAVIVLDQNGTFAISLLSGHLGGANYLTKRIAAAIQAQPVITTATDVQGVLSFDEVAKQNDLCIENLEELKYISGALLDGKTIDLYSELPLQTPYFCALINVTETPTAPYRVVISSNIYPPEEDVHTLFLRPKNLVIGIGCKRDTIPEHLEICFQEFFANPSSKPSFGHYNGNDPAKKKSRAGNLSALRKSMDSSWKLFQTMPFATAGIYSRICICAADHRASGSGRSLQLSGIRLRRCIDRKSAVSGSDFCSMQKIASGAGVKGG